MGSLLAHAEAGERVYVLSAINWDPSKISPRLQSWPKVLFRRVPELPVSGVITSGGAWLWLGDNAEAGNRWTLQLDNEQTEAFRQIFLRQFWHRAVDEAWTGGHRPTFRPARERPFDVPELPRTAPVRLVSADASLDLDEPGALVHRTGGEPPAGPLRRLWIPPGGSHHDQLARLVRGGAEVVWANRGLPDIALGAQRGVMLIPGSGGRLRIELNRDQAAAAARILEEPGVWRFETDVRLGDHALGDTQLRPSGAVAAHPVQPEQIINLGHVQAALLRSVADEIPTSWPPPAPLSLSVRYQWIVVPPRLPAHTEEDGLVKKWRQLDELWAKRLAKVRDALRGTENERGRLGRAFSRLVGAMLGFERTEGSLREDLARLEVQKPSVAGMQGAGQLLERLARLEEEAQRLRGNLEDAEHKALEADERDTQEAAWRKRLDEARRTLPDRRTALASAQDRRAELDSELDNTVSALKSADQAAKKDLKVRRAKLVDDCDRLDKSIQRLDQEVADLVQREAEPFVFKPPAIAAKRSLPDGARFVPAASTPSPANLVPDEALPAVGRLRNLRGQRYLVIETWEELAPGEESAARLKARLVAPEDA